MIYGLQLNIRKFLERDVYGQIIVRLVFSRDPVVRIQDHLNRIVFQRIWNKCNSYRIPEIKISDYRILGRRRYSAFLDYRPDLTGVCKSP